MVLDLWLLWLNRLILELWLLWLVLDLRLIWLVLDLLWLRWQRSLSGADSLRHYNWPYRLVDRFRVNDSRRWTDFDCLLNLHAVRTNTSVSTAERWLTAVVARLIRWSLWYVAVRAYSSVRAAVRTNTSIRASEVHYRWLGHRYDWICRS